MSSVVCRKLQTQKKKTKNDKKKMKIDKVFTISAIF